MKKFFVAAAVLTAAVAVIPTLANAANITFSNSTRVTGSLVAGVSATFTNDANTISISCTTHTVTALLADQSSLGSGTSTGTSLIIRPGNNRYTTSGAGGETSCTYSAGGGIFTGFVTIVISCNWVFTARTTTTGSLDFTAANCITINLHTGGIAGCVIQMGAQTIATGLSMSSAAGPTTVEVTARNAPITYTTNGRCAGDAGGRARQAERLLVRTVGLSG